MIGNRLRAERGDMDDQALHISNGIIDGPVSGMFAALAVAAVAFCVLRARSDLDERLAPMAGLVAAFIFAVQMLNFPVLPGVSGHLLGGTLAALLVGPWVGALCVTVVLVVQALLFADGGVTALGLNVTNMALLGTAAGYLVVLGLLRLKLALPATALIASVISVGIAAQGFVLQYALGGGGGLSVGAVSAAMAGPHLLIGLGEGLITAVTVQTVARARPDLVYALRGASRAASVPSRVEGTQHVA
jgi:cobalt/nickel transport system permease protein